ncbi:acyl-CoA thioesterase [Profundibacterium mesophilum]|uniref:Acyl-CoA thioesterase 2 n=1 Tax=Profundibacterium mesophilum KAUST100406-0324 TaxID=1037889 RepID=A0A921TE49_9RHOB|nr:acyl-CoA thioesterase II [Profundibacterium mesophilum]KAF0676932.1 Acyl-CoA thioesterase II [Profundibacterium mesophilum KAUST100406-0324]
MTATPPTAQDDGDPVDRLLSLLSIERLDRDLFRARSGIASPRRRIFGGQVIAQALMAACRTVEGRRCHSLHAYFLRPGDPSIPVIYEVDRVRDGGSFTTRQVSAVQNGAQIFNLAASFQADEESPVVHHPLPFAPPDPDTMPDRDTARRAAAAGLPPEWAEDYARPSAIELREIDPIDPADPSPASDRNAAWFRVSRPAGGDDHLQQCLMAYATDMKLLASALRPLGRSILSPEVMPASLDHAIWFHQKIDFDHWHLYVMDSPFTGGARGFNRGSIFRQDGALVASVAQEGLLRPIVPRG